MHITFLAHDGFLIELDRHCLLFDWWKGELPSLPEKPLLVFVSHRHEDHFKPEIFQLTAQKPDTRFFLGSDFRLTPKNLEKWAITPETAALCRRCGKHEDFSPLPEVRIETFPSTDEGVAWMVTVENRAIFHTGDLNWWHWEEESHAYNRNMETNFKRYTAPLQGRSADLAMLPLDPRLEAPYGFYGPLYFLQQMHIRHFLPMHQWDRPDFTQQFLEAYPQYAPITHPLHHDGEQFELT